MSDFANAFLGAIGFFFVYAMVQSLISLRPIQRIYWFYGAYLFFIFTYFFLRGKSADGTGIDIGHLEIEEFFVSAIAISYLFFAKVFFQGCESYPYFRSIANSGLYLVLLCLVIGILLDYFNVPPINLIEGFLRALLALMGIYAATVAYFKSPQDRSFSIYFIIGNYMVLLGAVVTAIFAIMDSCIYHFMPQYQQHAYWIQKTEFIPVEAGIILEMFCFSIAIVKRQQTVQKFVLPHGETVPQPAPEDDLALRISFKTSTGFEILKKEDIICIEGGGNSANFVRLYREGTTSPIVILHTLTNCLSMLHHKSGVFIQPHKSYIINVQKVKGIAKRKDGIEVIVMSNKKEIPIPREKKEAIRKHIKPH